MLTPDRSLSYQIVSCVNDGAQEWLLLAWNQFQAHNVTGKSNLSNSLKFLKEIKSFDLEPFLASIRRENRPHFRMNERFKTNDLTSELYLVSTNALLPICSKGGYKINSEMDYFDS